PLTIQISVQTSGVGSISVAPVMIRNEAEETTTDSSTTNSPSVRTACLLVPRNSGGRSFAGAGAAAGSGSVALGVACIKGPILGRTRRECGPVGATLQDKCCQNVTPGQRGRPMSTIPDGATA